MPQKKRTSTILTFKSLTRWAEYFSFGYPLGAWWNIDWFVQYRLKMDLKRRSQRPYQTPKGMNRWEHILSFGLVPLAKSSRKRPAHA